MSLMQFLFGLSGRVNRKPFWLFILAWTGIYLIVLGNFIVATLVYGHNIETPALQFKLFMVIGGFSLLSMWPGFAVSAKRLQDRNRSIWWLVSFYILAIAVTGASLLLIPATAGSDGAVAMVVLVATFIYGVIGFWLFIEMAFLRGTRGENRFGPDPLEGRP
ncbi:MAG: DUF805 domain-containing protein [Hyphomicrobiaceae bacterium]|nr:DUF805 domain-containing protein [Hyphomicrobiaceae bacterium]